MFDDLRQQADEGAFEEQPTETGFTGFREPKQHFLGMSPFQRFVIAIELLMMVCITGTFVLLVLGKVVPPFLK